MVVAIATWSLVVSPGKKVTQEVYRDFKITNAALGAKLEDEKARSTLKVSYEPPPLSDLDSDEEDSPKKGSPKKVKKSEIALCSLTPGTIEQAALDITFLEEDVVEFEVVGKNSVHLFGNYVGMHNVFGAPLPTDLPPDFSDEDESVDLRDVSSDVEMNPDDIIGLDDSDDEEYVFLSRFEEVEDKPTAGKKHPRDSDATADASMASTSAKKANKKLKGESGSAVPVNTEAESKANGEATESKKEKKKKDKKKDKGDAKSDVEAQSGGEGTATKASSPLKMLSGGLQVKDVKVGTGKQAKAGNTVSMRYIGKLPDGTKFDSNTKGKPFTFRLGKGEVIKGWDQGVAGMQVGGERLLIIPPALAYGNKAQQGIPAGSTLHFGERILSSLQAYSDCGLECKLVQIK
ncbi:hypothetical protein JB92DRAFT_2697771 [Gautieria morchelliformis]|nr:hypothetical protein JB92DRAFT_2697771 [Gautieria morchelliformis]